MVCGRCFFGNMDTFYVRIGSFCEVLLLLSNVLKKYFLLNVQKQLRISRIENNNYLWFEIVVISLDLIVLDLQQQFHQARSYYVYVVHVVHVNMSIVFFFNTHIVAKISKTQFCCLCPILLLLTPHQSNNLHSSLLMKTSCCCCCCCDTIIFYINHCQKQGILQQYKLLFKSAQAWLKCNLVVYKIQSQNKLQIYRWFKNCFQSTVMEWLVQQMYLQHGCQYVYIQCIQSQITLQVSFTFVLIQDKLIINIKKGDITLAQLHSLSSCGRFFSSII
eukprot:TRINITY_DN7805_c0_g1_i2.p1 TRINITY_DN7805_c0_g1~~TRINITY_DN7805_c0_g1_i2.p1  ORF type:complete len:275 (-),score=-13.72 TRINITY_DN7805_c0_g1_i2:378-1202(-)